MSFFNMARAIVLILLLQFWPGAGIPPVAAAAIEHDVQSKRVVLSDPGHNLVLRLDYNGRCALDQVRVSGREVIANDTGVYSAVKIGGQWFTTRTGIPTPTVEATSDTLTVTGIRFAGGGMEVTEEWRFT